jgi:hypothetical protein
MIKAADAGRQTLSRTIERRSVAVAVAVPNIGTCYATLQP